MSNKDFYNETFSKLHSSYNSISDVRNMKKTSNFRMSKKLIVVISIIALMFALSCVTYAATDGKIVDDVKEKINLIINGNKTKVAKNESGKAEIEFKENDKIEYNNESKTVSIEAGDTDGKVIIDENNSDTDVEIELGKEE